jgi:hypothetical protein
MIQLIPQLRILLACKPIDFRKGIDGLVCLHRKDGAGWKQKLAPSLHRIKNLQDASQTQVEA